MANQSKPATNRISKERRELIGAYADAAACLYGAISLSEFADVFNHYESDKTDASEAEKALLRHAKLKPDQVEFTLYQGYLTGPTLHPDEFEDDESYLWDIRAKQKGKPRYLPATKEDFLMFSDALYIEPKKSYDELKEYIINSKLCNTDDEYEIEGEMLDLNEMIQNGVPINDLLQYFVDGGYELNDIDAINDFMQRVVSVSNNTRMYENNGYTPIELGKLRAAELPRGMVINRPAKIGRNDPCPCGSGKKYKKCCALLITSGTAGKEQA